MFKKKIAKVGWMCLAPEWDPLMIPPESLNKIFASKGSTSYGKCPSIRSAYSQYFLIRSPIDIELHVDKDGLLGGCPAHVLNLKNYLDFFNQISPSACRTPDHRITQIRLMMGFASDDKDVHITILPPFLHDESFDRPIRAVIGRYNIYDWPYRNMNLAFEWTDPNKKISLKRGDPLAYIHLTHPDPEMKFAMVEVDPDKCRKDVRHNRSFNDLINGSSAAIMKLFGKRRPKTVIIPRREE